MTDHTSNDNQPWRALPSARDPDAHGQAALLLVESLLHGLISRSIISTSDAIEIVEVASEVKEEVAAELHEAKPTMERSLALLGAVRDSLGLDLLQG